MVIRKWWLMGIIIAWIWAIMLGVKVGRIKAERTDLAKSRWKFSKQKTLASNSQWWAVTYYTSTESDTQHKQDSRHASAFGGAPLPSSRACSSSLPLWTPAARTSMLPHGSSLLNHFKSWTATTFHQYKLSNHNPKIQIAQKSEISYSRSFWEFGSLDFLIRAVQRVKMCTNITKAPNLEMFLIPSIQIKNFSTSIWLV